MANDRLEPRLRILLGASIAVGPGKAALLELIGETGSIAAAGRRMGMSYRRAWVLTKTMNACFSAPLVEAAKGGGGGARLTAMGPTLNTAAAMDGYTLADRGTWLNFKNRQNLTILVEGDRRLFNQFGVMLVNPEKHPHVKQDLARRFIEWLISPAGQRTIADYKINGEPLFVPDAKG